MAKLAGLPGVLRGWDQFTDAVRGASARTAWELAHGMSLSEHLAARPGDAAVFQQGLSAFSAIEAQAMVDAYDFSGIDTLVDVGGGHGLLLATILTAKPRLSGVVFELPFVLDGARELLGERGVADRCATIAGDCFESAPEYAELRKAPRPADAGDRRPRTYRGGISRTSARRRTPGLDLITHTLRRAPDASLRAADKAPHRCVEPIGPLVAKGEPCRSLASVGG